MKNKLKPCLTEGCSEWNGGYDGTNCMSIRGHILDYCKRYTPEEQPEEPIKPEYSDILECYYCGECEGVFNNSLFKYCPYCGKKVNWSEEPTPKCIQCEKPLTQDEIKVYQCSCGAMEIKKQVPAEWRPIRPGVAYEQWQFEENVNEGIQQNRDSIEAQIVRNAVFNARFKILENKIKALEERSKE
jgi:hypothetical protein